MSVPFYNSVTDKVARGKLGVSTSDFDSIVRDGHLLVDSLNTNKTFVCSASLDKYIKEFGGKEARFRDKVDKKLFEASIKEISRVKKEIDSIKKNNKKNLEDIQNNSLYHYTIRNSLNSILSDIIKGTSRDIEIIAHKTLSDILGASIKELHLLSDYKKMPYSKNEIADIDSYMKTIKLFRKNSKILKELHRLGFKDSELSDYYELKDSKVKPLFRNISIEALSYSKNEYSNFFLTYKSIKKAYESISYEVSDSVKQEVIAKCEKQYNKSIVF